MITPGEWAEIKFEWSQVNDSSNADCKLYVNDELKVIDFPLNNSSRNGISYVHFHSPAVETDSLGFLVEEVQARLPFKNSRSNT